MYVHKGMREKMRS